MINEEVLLKNNYKEYNVPVINFADKFYQKKVADDKGVKYFINFLYYKDVDSYECEVQFELKKFCYMNINLFGFDYDTTLEAIELKIDNLWKTQN